MTTRRSFLDQCRRRRGWRRRARRRRAGWPASIAAVAGENEVLPKHVTPETIRAVNKGLDYLAAQQADDGSWITGGGQAYPGGHDGPGRDGAPGPRRLAHARQVLEDRARGRRVPGAVRHAHGAHYRAQSG